jgi:hypothetical protein
VKEKPVSYDANGSVIAYGNDSYTRDVRHRLVGLERVGDHPLSASFAYDWRGRRVSKTIGFNVYTMLNDGPNCVAENGSPAVHGPFLDSPIRRGGAYYVQDGLGSVTVLTAETGAVVGGHRYEPFGEVLGGTFVNPYQFTGRENDGTGR